MMATLPSRKEGFLREDLGDEILLCDTDSQVIHVLNRTAQLIWELCDGKHSTAEIESALRSRFSMTAERDLKADIQDTLRVFAEKGLLA